MTAIAPHIYTLTGHLLAERTFVFDDWAAGRTQRAKNQSFQVGGKGINVSRMLQRLEAPTTALCFAGGPSGMECLAWLRTQGVPFAAFPTQAGTRSGFVVRGSQQPETTFLGPDMPLEPAALHACVAYLDAQPSGQVLALCGSVPGWDEAACDPLRAALERWLERGILVMDTYGPPLAWAARQPLALIKINRAEFAGLFAGRFPLERLTEGLQLASTEWPVQRWIVTDGAGDVWVCAKGSQPARFTPPPIREVSPTGSGDVLLACVLHALYRRHATLPEAVAYALPFAAANAAHPGVAEFALPIFAP